MSCDTVITGLGIVNPSGIGIEEYWKNISAGANSLSHITRFDCSHYPLQIAGQLSDFCATNYVPRRSAVKMAAFSKYACAATNLAIADANLDVQTLDPYRAGVWLGNNSGGWDICEQGLFELYRGGAAAVNPWQATAWFLSSAQGYVSIINGLKGMSKSFCSDRTSAAATFYFATHAISLSRCDVILAGGTEAPITAFGQTCFYDTGEFATSSDDTECYKPFDKNRNGMVLGEGGAVLILENEKHARERHAHIYGKILGVEMSNDYETRAFCNLAKSIKRILDCAGISPKDVDLIFPEGAAVYDSDYAEAMAIHEVFGNDADVPLTCPKAGYGHLYGGSMASDMASAVLSGKNKLIPPTPNVTSPDFGLNLILEPQRGDLRYIMMISRAREGGNVVILISIEL